ncbi:hypothetical protein RchiOBHm_Chr6g0247141 [Rosa chinensis]|uniref:Uncharacterized protein n=1 Tax=Rosa chinensis TaxID=74649 RepID=A0A2P6PJQ1_ROSCH|nr:hypothetical protein RchiOBHm_Chr6g0247141 [Rosa chinensis]
MFQYLTTMWRPNGVYWQLRTGPLWDSSLWSGVWVLTSKTWTRPEILAAVMRRSSQRKQAEVTTSFKEMVEVGENCYHIHRQSRGLPHKQEHSKIQSERTKGIGPENHLIEMETRGVRWVWIWKVEGMRWSPGSRFLSLGMCV